LNLLQLSDFKAKIHQI